MIDRGVLARELARRVSTLEDDLRERAQLAPEVGAVVRSEWQAAHDAGRTAHDEAVWAESLYTQVAVAWVLATVFIRFSEDNGLITDPVLSGPGDGLRRSEEAQRAWFRQQPPELGDRDYVEDVFRQMASLPGIGHVFETHNPAWLFGPSEDAVRDLLGFWREVDPETGELRRDFTDPTWDTRFLGDLYEQLSQHAQDEYALHQTPDYIETFVLDRTLEPALEEFPLDDFKMIDPACGSGHFLLGSFHRLFARWSIRAPHEGNKALAARALKSVYGVDLNPFAASIARFRLLVAALKLSESPAFTTAPNFVVNVVVGDALLHGPPPATGSQHSFGEYGVAEGPTRHLYAAEDVGKIHRFLQSGYHAVVANPPFITPNDPAANLAYRQRYPVSCHGLYHLSSPFLERLFDLAVKSVDGRPAGYVGLIQDNAFMKRGFGRQLIEQFLAKSVELTHIVDTESLNVGGHGTATVILFGRARPPFSSSVRCAIGRQGDALARSDPSRSQVWLSYVGHLDQPGWMNEYVAIFNVDRSQLRSHPWSLVDPETAALKRSIELAAGCRLASKIDTIGYTGQTNADEVMLAPEAAFLRRGVRHDDLRTMVVGDAQRDWGFAGGDSAIFPYGQTELRDLDPSSAMSRWLWPARTTLGARRTFNKKSYLEEGRAWWGWHQMALQRTLPGTFLSVAFVATNSHFVLHGPGRVFNRSAPIVITHGQAARAELVEFLGPLNSSVASFWMKLILYCKGAGGVNEGFKAEQWERFYEFDGTKLKQFPLPTGSAVAWAERLDALALELSANLPRAVAEREAPTRAALDAARARVEEIRREMVAVQEELDWRCLFLYRVTDQDMSFEPGEVLGIDRGQRAFEIVLARKMAAREVSTTWFTRHQSTAITEIPAEWPPTYRQRVEERIALIGSNRGLSLVERPEYKRRWNWDSWEDLEAEALRVWLLDRLENPRYWPGLQPRSVAQLADTARLDADLVSVAEVYLGTIDIDLVSLITELVRKESVPYLAALRYTDAGLRTRAAWERTWDLQRAEDRGEYEGTIPVPPKYGKTDFRQEPSWKLRGKLDVPKERFVAYPGLERPTDQAPVVGWAGWDHLEQAQALAALYGQRQAVEGWESERLLPIVAGLAELVPWLQQWHNEPDADGTRMGDFFTTFVASEAATNRFSDADLASWRPPAKVRGRRKAADE